jgi:hypothetical protein
MSFAKRGFLPAGLGPGMYTLPRQTASFGSPWGMVIGTLGPRSIRLAPAPCRSPRPSGTRTHNREQDLLDLRSGVPLVTTTQGSCVTSRDAPSRMVGTHPYLVQFVPRSYLTTSYGSREFLALIPVLIPPISLLAAEDI